MRRTHKYADGGKVVKSYADGGMVPYASEEAARKTAKDGATRQVRKGAKARIPKTPTPEMLGSGAAASAGRSLRDTRKEQMRKLDLADGGPVADAALEKAKKVRSKVKLKAPPLPKVKSPVR